MKARLINNFKKQNAVYWANPVNDGYGDYTFDSPVEIQVQWENKQEKFVSALNGEEVISRAVIFVPQDLAIQGMLSLMSIANISSSELPADNNAYEIKASEKVPDHRGTNFSRKVWL